METLQIEEDEGVRIVRLNRPPMNPVNRQMISDLSEAFADIVDNRNVRVVVVSAVGDRAFCAGIDLKERHAERTAGRPGDEALANLLDSGKAWREASLAIHNCPVPVVAAVDGPAIGAGLGIAGAADIIYASRRAKFGLTEINVGVLGGSRKAIQMLGPYKGRMMFFTGELISAEEFYRRGVLEELVEDGTAEAHALEMAGLLAKKSPIGLRLAKESLLRTEYMDPDKGYRVEQDYTSRLRQFNDSGEAMAAYLERRDPVWTWS